MLIMTNKDPCGVSTFFICTLYIVDKKSVLDTVCLLRNKGINEDITV